MQNKRQKEIKSEKIYNYDRNTSIDNSGTCIVPEGIEKIGAKCCYNDHCLTTLILPKSLKYIDCMSFFACGGLKSITIGNKITSISEKVFCGAYRIREIRFMGNVAQWCKATFGPAYLYAPPEGIRDYGVRWEDDGTITFAEKPGYDLYINDKLVTKLIIPKSVKYIANGKFMHCNSINEVVINNGATIIQGFAFSKCVNLSNVTIPDSVTIIEYSAFSECPALTNVTIPDSVTTIEEYAFEYCPCIKVINGVSYVDKWVVDCDYRTVTDVTLEIGTKGIANCAFRNCKNLKRIVLPDGVIAIGNNAWEECTGLKSITIPDSVKSIGNKAFYWCYNLNEIYFKGTVEQWKRINEKNYWQSYIPIKCKIYCSNGILQRQR